MCDLCVYVYVCVGGCGSGCVCMCVCVCGVLWIDDVDVPDCVRVADFFDAFARACVCVCV
jgi:hypothetical protein